MVFKVGYCLFGLVWARVIGLGCVGLGLGPGGEGGGGGRVEVRVGWR